MDHCHYTGEYTAATHSISNLKYSLPKEIPIVFHNGYNYVNHFIAKKLVEGQFTCLGKKKEAKRIDEKQKIISYRLQFIDSTRLMESSLSNLVNLAK